MKVTLTQIAVIQLSAKALDEISKWCWATSDDGDNMMIAYDSFCDYIEEPTLFSPEVLTELKERYDELQELDHHVTDIQFHS